MGVEITAAIFGAIFGTLANGIIEIVKFFSGRKSLKKAVQLGLYFEIDHHKIVELRKDEDGQPNFVLASFQDQFYDNNISAFTKLCSEKIIQHLTFYYSSLKSVLDHQNDLLKINSEINELISKMPRTNEDSQRYEKLIKQRNGIKEVLRVYLAPCINTRQALLAELKKVFKKDPSEIKHIDVLPEHEEWWKKIQNEKLHS